MCKNHITVLVGAGACLEINGPTTKTITKASKSIIISSDVDSETFVNSIENSLNAYYGQDNWNFEDLFHTLEMLNSYTRCWDPNLVKKYKPTLGAFVTQIDNSIFDSGKLDETKRKLIESIAECIDRYNEPYASSENNEWYGNFWRKFDKKAYLDIVTLNYDTCIEQSLVTYEDGFKKHKKVYYEFDPRLLKNSRKSKVMHLHGCINYGYKATQEESSSFNVPFPTENASKQDFRNFLFSNKYTSYTKNHSSKKKINDNFHDLCKFDSYAVAKETWYWRSNPSVQSGENIVIGPIITGLRKTDKVLVYPYTAYYNEFQNALFANSSLLIIGYSFGDRYLNSLLNKFAKCGNLEPLARSLRAACALSQNHLTRDYRANNIFLL